MDTLSSLKSAVDFIENNMLDEINLNQAARICALNEYELSNLFHSLTGMTIKEYIRKRRLTLAGYDLQRTDERVIDIAVKYGYDSADSFRRAFTAQHNATPSAVRNNNAPINIYPPLSFEISVKGADKMNFKIVDIEQMEVWGISTPCYSSGKNRYDFAREMWSDECRHIPSEICDGYDGIWYAIWKSNSYFIARDKGNCTKSGLEKTIIPSGKYAVFTTEKGGYAGDELPRLHSRIFDSWLPNSEYDLSSDFEPEVYHLATDRKTRRRERYYEIWIPVTEKKNASKNTNVKIRSAVFNDADFLSDICSNDLGYSCTEELIKAQLEKINIDRECVLVAQVDNKVVGFVHIELYNLLYCKAGANILGLAVASDYQKQGIGKALMNSAENWAEQRGASFVRLNSGKSRSAAHMFYRSLGYDNEKEQIRFMKMI